MLLLHWYGVNIFLCVNIFENNMHFILLSPSPFFPVFLPVKEKSLNYDIYNYYIYVRT